MSKPLIHPDGRILAALDTSIYASSVADHAAWAAARLGSPLELLHVLERERPAAQADLSGNLALDAQESLLTELAELDARRGKLSQSQGRALLETARARIAERSGQGAEIRQIHGPLVDTLLELEPGVRLFVLGKRGEHADFASGHLGSNLERVVRAVHRPVLVTPRAFRAISRFMIAFDGSATTRRCVDMVCASPLLQGLPCHLLVVAEPAARPAEAIDWAVSRLVDAGFDHDVVVVPGTADAVIAEQAAKYGAELLVMGAYGHSRIRNMIVGSTTTQVLRSSSIPVLLLR